jgi:predicted ester cyclase
VSVEENKAIVRRWTEEGFGRGNLTVADEMVATDFVNHNPVAGQRPGREGLKQAVAMLRGAFPDLRVEIEDMIAEGDRVAGIPPTDKRVAVTRIAVFRVVDGEIAEHRAQVDILGPLRRLGEIPPSGQGSS